MTSDLEKVRLEIGDTTSSAALFTDEEIQSKLATQTNVMLCAAELCDILATRFARDFDFTTDGQSFKRGSRSGMYAARAKTLRERAGGVSVIVTTRADGYSDDLSTRDGAGQVSPASGRVRRGYWPPDQIPS